MTNSVPTIAAIQSALAPMASGHLPQVATELLKTLGYHSERQLDGQTGKVNDFNRCFPASNPERQSNTIFNMKVKNIFILFQSTDEEIVDLKTKTSNQDNIRSFLFIAVQLNNLICSYKDYLELTREINKRFEFVSTCIVTVFRNDGNNKAKLISVAIADRRSHKIFPDRLVIGKISLIHEINCRHPHRLDLKTLSKLSLPVSLQEISNNNTQNFDGLMKSLLATLRTAENNRQYEKLFTWFKQISDGNFAAQYPSCLPILKRDDEIELAQKIDDLLYLQKERKIYFDENKCYPSVSEWAGRVNMSRTSFKRRLRLGQQAKGKIVQLNLRLVIYIIKKMKINKEIMNRDLSFQDLIQEGSLGLVRAAEKFDHEKGYKFSTYATW
ncbi:MAG: hypothetical protein OXF25_07915, partial [Cyanobacteria bacterium MAG CAR3_bin_5]|nr:hypothetical protein [Cyanobacteria bacterium MAG CAR3_bin_5]